MGWLVTAAWLRLWSYEAVGRRSTDRAIAALQAWCRSVCRRLHIAVEGAAPSDVVLFVANHRSYLDIPVLASVLPATFLAKADVETMTLVGRVARHTGAVFVDRDDATDRSRAARALRRRLRDTSVIAFPEGTTGGQASVADFAPGAFRLAHRGGIAVVPVTIRYGDRRAYWVEDLGVGEHLRRNVLGHEPLRCTVHVGTRCDPARFADPDAFAAAVHAAVAAPIVAKGELA